ncbi:MAG: hypothetical protein J6T98_00160 [Salinivirgaceae bacterium]|nr:hypothetical protein [Salinivirgaceae bacterium]
MKQFVAIFCLCATFCHSQAQQKIDSLFANQLNSFVETNADIESVKDFLLSRGMEYETFEIMAKTDKVDNRGMPLYYDKKKIHWFKIGKREYDGSFYAWPFEIFMPDDEPTNFILYTRCADRADFCEDLHKGIEKYHRSKQWQIKISIGYVPFYVTNPKLEDYLLPLQSRFKSFYIY